MAQFIGKVSGNRGEASRLGHKTSGLDVKAYGWNLGVQVHAEHKDGADEFSIFMTGGSNASLNKTYIGLVRDGKFFPVIKKAGK